MIKYLLIIIGILPFIVACKKDQKCPECFTPPEGMTLRLISTADKTDLLFTNYYNKESVKLFYVNNYSLYPLEIEFHTDSLNQSTILHSHEISWKSVSGIKTFYLQLSVNDTDTIQLDIISKSNDCCTFHVCNSFTYNQQDYGNRPGNMNIIMK